MAARDAYLLSTFRADLAGGWHDHLGVWATLEAAQAYSTQIGGRGDWDTVEYDSVEYWSRGTADPALRHKIEGIAYLGHGAVVD